MTVRAPARRRPVFRPQWTISMAVALGALGFAGVAQWNSSLARQEVVTDAQSVLVTRAQDLQRDQQQLRTDLEAAEAQLRQLQEQAAGLGALEPRLDAASVAAGVVPMRGPGAVIEIGDSLRPTAPGQAEGFFVVAEDLRNIVTALWASGADAIAITGSVLEGAPATRLVSNSAIVGVGGAIAVNGTALSPPYRIEAIGPEGLLDRAQAHPAFLARVRPRIDGFGLQYASEARNEVVVPGFVSVPTWQWGAPLEEPDEEGPR